MHVFRVFLLHYRCQVFFRVGLFLLLLALRLPPPSFSQKIVLRLYTFRTTLPNNAYLPWCQKTNAMNTIAMILIILTGTLMIYFVIRLSIQVFLFHIQFNQFSSYLQEQFYPDLSDSRTPKLPSLYSIIMFPLLRQLFLFTYKSIILDKVFRTRLKRFFDAMIVLAQLAPPERDMTSAPMNSFACFISPSPQILCPSTITFQTKTNFCLLVNSVIQLFMNSLKELTYYKFRQMNPNQLFAQTKLQILNNKRAYMTQHLQQLENNVTISQMDNMHLKERVDQLKKQLNANQQRQSINSGSKIDMYKREEREKTKKIEELNKLIDEYKYLCQAGIRYTNASPSFSKQSSQDQQENSLSISQTDIKLNKKIKTKIYCHPCQHQFLPQEYYRHCQEYHPDSSGYKSLRN